MPQNYGGLRGGMPEVLWAQGGAGRSFWGLKGGVCRYFCGLGGGGVCGNFWGLAGAMPKLLDA